MTYTVSWTPDEFVKDLRGAVAKGLTAGAIVLQKEMKNNMGSESGGVVGKTKSGRNVYKSSQPGHFPARRTGNLSRSIISTKATPDRLIAAAGSSTGGRSGDADRYGLMLEFGTSKMAPRPWIMRSFNRSRENVFDAIATTAKAEFQRQTDRKAVRT